VTCVDGFRAAHVAGGGAASDAAAWCRPVARGRVPTRRGPARRDERGPSSRRPATPRPTLTAATTTLHVCGNRRAVRLRVCLRRASRR
jgi:hypothetical protein